MKIENMFYNRYEKTFPNCYINKVESQKSK